MAKNSRDVHSLQVKFIFSQGDFSEVVDKANAFCRDVPTSCNVKFRRLSSSVSSMVADAVHRGKNNWVAIVEMVIALESNSSRPEPTYIQYEYFTSDDSANLEMQINEFCKNHQASKVDFLWHNHEPGTWTVTVRYHVF